MRKKWLLVLPVAVLAGALVPFMGSGWNSLCACLSATEAFAGFSGVLMDKPVEPDIVAAALTRRFPIGTSFEQVREGMPYPQREGGLCKIEGTVSRCQFWLQKNGSQERGYEVIFSLSREQTLTGIGARQIQRGG